MAVGLDQEVVVEIVWVKPHIVTIKIGDEIHNLNLPWSVESVNVTASTGEMEIDQLMLGTGSN